MEEGQKVWPPPYEARSIRCHGCVTLDDEQEFAGDKAKGIYFYLAPWTGESEQFDGP